MVLWLSNRPHTVQTSQFPPVLGYAHDSQADVAVHCNARILSSILESTSLFKSSPLQVTAANLRWT